jgi:cell division protein ZapA (FtsZ GTPase activity inhibitor)
MDKLQIIICNRSYTLRTDECPERIAQIAAKLDEKIAEFMTAMKGRPEYEILTIAAFDLMEQADNAVSEAERLKAELEETEVKNKQLLIENMNSAGSELYQIAAVKEQENSALRAQLHDYEQVLDSKIAGANSANNAELERIIAGLEQENAELCAKITEILPHKDSAERKEMENQRLTETLSNFERSFDEFAKAKENELLKMQEEIEALKLKLAELSEDGQLTLV